MTGELLILSDDRKKAVPNPLVMGVKEFRVLVERDKSGKLAPAEFAYIYHMANPLSPYASYADDLREEKVTRDYLPEGWKPDNTVWEAVKKYKELCLPPSAHLLEGMLRGVHKLNSFIDTLDLEAVDKNGRPIYKPTDLTAAMEKGPKLAESLSELRDKVLAEQTGQNQNRGGVRVSKYND